MKKVPCPSPFKEGFKPFARFRSEHASPAVDIAKPKNPLRRLIDGEITTEEYIDDLKRRVDKDLASYAAQKRGFGSNVKPKKAK